MAPQNPRNGMWVQVWVPLPDPDSTSANQYDTLTGNTIFDESNTPYSTGNASSGFIPDSSDSPESFLASSYGSSPSTTLDSSFNPDDFVPDPLPFPPPQDGGLGTNLDLELGFDFEGGMDISAPLPVSDTLLADLDPLAPLVDGSWNLNTGIDNATTAPQVTPSYDSVSLSPSISTSSHLHTPPFLPIPALPSNGATPSLPALQPASPRPGCTTATASTACSAPYRCASCPKAYSKRCGLTRHEKKHLKPHRCQLCNFGSAELRGLQRHMWASHREVAEREGVPKQIARCEVCGYEGRLDNVMRHMKRHDKDRARGNKRKAAERKRG